MRTAVFKLCGHVEIGPIAVPDQSNVRIRSPSSPPPEKTSVGICAGVRNDVALLAEEKPGCALRVVKKICSAKIILRLYAENGVITQPVQAATKITTYASMDFSSLARFTSQLPQNFFRKSRTYLILLTIDFMGYRKSFDAGGNRLDAAF